jgi:hypothetical protein
LRPAPTGASLTRNPYLGRYSLLTSLS